MARPIRKYIMVPEYRPLFAMQECFGPQHGPLKEPCPTPIPVIGKLLRQDGNNKLTIYEVLKNSDRTFSSPVLLTLDNYTLPYDEILNGKKADPGPALTPVKTEVEAVAPVIGNFTAQIHTPEPKQEELHPEPEPDSVVEAGSATEEPVESQDVQHEDAPVPDDGTDSETDNDEADESANMSQDETAEDSTVTADAEIASPELPAEPEVTVTAGPGVEVEAITPKVKPYGQMSKKERKEYARKMAAEAAAKTGTDSQEK